MNATAWARRTFRLRAVTSDQLLYDHMESQSGHRLPILYQPFDPDRRAHWHDRGAILDFAVAAGSGRVLDVGPGDGWPSIPMSPFCSSVTGVEASARRVEVCRANARRLGCRNVEFIHVPQGERLPFPDASFDGVVAATSLEQSGNPKEALRELHRILKPGGRLRMTYESLDTYVGGREEEVWLDALDGDRSQVVFYERQPEKERALHVAIRLNAPLERTRSLLQLDADSPPPRDLPDSALERLRPLVFDAVTCTLTHPSCRTWLAWFKEAGFTSARPTHWPASIAAALYDHLSPGERPRTLDELDRLLMPIARRVSREAATQTRTENVVGPLHPAAARLLSRSVSLDGAPPILAEK